MSLRAAVAKGGVRRTAAGVASVLAAWVALDGLRHAPIGQGASGGGEFYLFWGVPFAVASVFLAWYAWRGANPASDRVARSGCLGAVALGGGAFLVLCLRCLTPARDLVGGVLDGLRFAPLAAVVGLGLGIAGAAVRRKPQ